MIPRLGSAALEVTISFPADVLQLTEVVDVGFSDEILEDSIERIAANFIRKFGIPHTGVIALPAERGADQRWDKFLIGNDTVRLSARMYSDRSVTLFAYRTEPVERYRVQVME